MLRRGRRGLRGRRSLFQILWEEGHEKVIGCFVEGGWVSVWALGRRDGAFGGRGLMKRCMGFMGFKERLEKLELEGEVTHCCSQSIDAFS